MSKYENLNVVTAPEEIKDIPRDAIKIFLAGGISGCHDWQSKCLSAMDEWCYSNDIFVFNPRRESFDLANASESARQIEWEFKYLEEMDIFSMYFAKSETSVGPICLYELGRYICRMQMRFPSTWMLHIVVSIENGYLRGNDVHIQTRLAAPQLFVIDDMSPEEHAERIMKLVNVLKMRRQNDR